MSKRDTHWDEVALEELVDDFVELGLTRNEARLYLAAYDQEAMRAAELAELAGVTRTKAYDALRELVSKGLFSRQPGRVTQFKAADPLEVVLRLRQQGLRDQAELLEDTNRLIADLFERYYAAPSSSDPFDYVELIRHGQAAWARAETIAAGAQTEALWLHPCPPGAAGVIDQGGARSGLTCRALYERRCLDDAAVRALLAEREAGGVQVRVAERVPLELGVVDRRTCILGLSAPGTAGQGSWVLLEHPGLASLLAGVFDELWAGAVPAAAILQAHR